MSKDTLYNFNSISPAQITREHYQNVGSGINTLGFVKRAFKGGTNFEMWTAPTGGTQLVEGVDYTIENQDIVLSSKSGFNVFTGYQVINATYQTGNIYITYRVIATNIDADYTEGISQKGLFRNAIVDSGFLLWDTGTTFTNPTNGAYTANMWIAERSGASPDQYIISRDTSTEDVHEPYICKIQVTAAGTGTKASSIYQKINEKEKFKNQPISARCRINFPLGADGYLFLNNGNETFQKNFTGLGIGQDVILEDITFSTTMTFFNVAVRFSDNIIDAVVGNYYIFEIQLFLSKITLPFEKKQESKITSCASYFFERKFSNFRRFRVTRYTTDILTFYIDFSRKRVAGTMTTGGVETTDWQIVSMSGVGQTGFALTNISFEDGLCRIDATKSTHGLTDGYLEIKNTSLSYIQVDARL